MTVFKGLLWASLILLLMAATTACGGGDESTETPTGTSAAPTELAETPTVSQDGPGPTTSPTEPAVLVPITIFEVT
jgi:hypothetical protein